tara:strand:+ start:144 stop:431 length:288 start_codon:yes stop_codon:yes gene_type:complete
MKWLIIASLVACVAISAVSSVVHAHSLNGCKPLQEIVDSAKNQYKEEMTQVHQMTDSLVVILLENPSYPRTWTLLAVHPNGVACILLTGKYAVGV